MIKVKGLLGRLSGYRLAHTPPVEPMTIRTEDGSDVIFESLLADAGIQVGTSEIYAQVEEGVVLLTTPDVAEKMQSDSDRAKLLELLALGFPECDQLIGSRVMLCWEHGEESIQGDTSMILIPNSTLTKIDNGLIWLVDRPGNYPTIVNARNIARATLAWTSIGKPEGVKPPRPELYF